MKRNTKIIIGIVLVVVVAAGVVGGLYIYSGTKIQSPIVGTWVSSIQLDSIITGDLKNEDTLYAIQFSEDGIFSTGIYDVKDGKFKETKWYQQSSEKGFKCKYELPDSEHVLLRWDLVDDKNLLLQQLKEEFEYPLQFFERFSGHIGEEAEYILARIFQDYYTVLTNDGNSRYLHFTINEYGTLTLYDPSNYDLFYGSYDNVSSEYGKTEVNIVKELLEQ